MITRRLRPHERQAIAALLAVQKRPPRERVLRYKLAKLQRLSPTNPVQGLGEEDENSFDWGGLIGAGMNVFGGLFGARQNAEYQRQLQKTDAQLQRDLAAIQGDVQRDLGIASMDLQRELGQTSLSIQGQVQVTTAQIQAESHKQMMVYAGIGLGGLAAVAGGIYLLSKKRRS